MNDCCPFVPGPDGSGGGGGAADGGVAISAGAASASTGTVVFSNSNGVTFGMAGQTVTASVGGDTFSYSQYAPLSMQSAAFNVNFPNSSLVIQPAQIPNLVFSQAAPPVFFSAASNSTGTVSFTYNFGIYTRNAGTLSLHASSSFTGSINHSGTENTALNNGIRVMSFGWSSTLTKCDYWVGVNFMTTTAGNNASFRLGLVEATRASVLSGFLGVASNASNQEILGRGFYSAATAALPAAIPFSDIRGTAIGAGSLPIVVLGVSV